MQRIFIAINLPKGIKEKIKKITEDLRGHSGLDIKWVVPENWHLTITFLGWQPDQAIDGIINALKDMVEEFSAPTVEFDKIVLFPDIENPRMIWVSGTEKSSQDLSKLKEDLENLLIDNNIRFKIEKRKFITHINLTSIRSEEARNLNIEELQKIIDEANLKLEKYLPLSFEAESLDLMGSHPEKGEEKYLVLSKFKFK